MPRLGALFGDKVHNTAHGIRSVESGCSTFDDLDASDIAEVEAVVVNVVHSLAGEPFAVNEKEHRIACETIHVQRGFLAHNKPELKAREFFGEKVLDVCGV